MRNCCAILYLLIALASTLCLLPGAHSTCPSQDASQTYSSLEELFHAVNGSHTKLAKTATSHWLDRSFSFCNWEGVCCCSCATGCVYTQEITSSCTVAASSVSCTLLEAEMQCEYPSSPSDNGNYFVGGLYLTDLEGPPTSVQSSSSVWQGLPMLEVLSLAGNRRMEYDFSFVDPNALQSLKSLILAETMLHGSIPHDIGVLGSLQFLDLASTFVNGTVPPEFQQLTSLRGLELSSTCLNYSMDAVLGYWPDFQYFEATSYDVTVLESLGITCNLNVVDALPSDIDSRVPALEVFKVNYWKGGKDPLPTTIGNMQGLKSLYVSSSVMDGTIPSELGNLSALLALSLHNTTLFGTIPPLWSSSSSTGLQNLRVLVLTDNTFLEGPLPEGLLQLPKLISVNIAYSPFINGPFPSIPTTSGLSQHLVILTLSNMPLTGTLPSQLGGFRNLSQVLVSHTLVGGTIPSSLLTLPSLQYLTLSNNQLSGELPSVDGSEVLTQLTTMDFSKNLLTGPIPVYYFLRFPNMFSFLVHFNGLIGSLSALVSNWVKLSTLNVAYNLMDGELPTTLGELTHLNVLNVSHNQFSGSLPAEISMLSSLYSLDLTYNEFIGSIPESLGNLSSTLHVLDFSHNNFTFLTLTSPWKVGKINIAYNRFSNHICNILTELSGSQIDTLDMSHNPIVGSLSDTRCLTPKDLLIGAVDVSYCSLSGIVPGMIVTVIPGLHFLRLDHNHNITSLPPTISTGGEIVALASDTLVMSIKNLSETVRLGAREVYSSAGVVLNSAQAWDYANYQPLGDLFSSENRMFFEQFSCPELNTPGMVYLDYSAAYTKYAKCVCAAGYVGTPPNCEFQDNRLSPGILSVLIVLGVIVMSTFSVWGTRKVRSYRRMKHSIRAAQDLLERFPGRQMARAKRQEAFSEVLKGQSKNPLELVHMSGVDEADFCESDFDPNLVIPYEALRMVDNIGQGAGGVVYLAVWNHLHVAVKRLPDGLDDVDSREMLHEAMLHSSLRHPNVVQLLGVCMEPFCTVTEFMAGGSLFDQLQQDITLYRDSPAKRVRTALDIARGIAYLHSRSIIHRDLKSMNILLTDTGVAKVADFGTSKSKQQEAAQRMMTMAVGTTAWMAPEVAGDPGGDKVGEYTEKCDVYSFGIILWEMLTGEIPFSDVAFSHQVLTKVVGGERPAIPPGVCPPDYIALMRQCWNGNPMQRPSFVDIVQRLERALEALK